MKNHPDFFRIRAVVERNVTKAVGFNGVVFRACSPAYANIRDVVTGEGARKFGGRWNAAGGFCVAYLSRSVEGAIAETLGLAGHYGFDPAARLPLTLVAVDVKVQRLLDLTDAVLRRELGITMTRINGCLWRRDNGGGKEAVTQAIGRATYEAGLQGLVVASSVKRTLRNINIFPQNLGQTGALTVRNADQLPPAPPASVL